MKHFTKFFTAVAVVMVSWTMVAMANDTSKTELAIRDVSMPTVPPNQPRSLTCIVSGVFDAALSTFTFTFYQPVGEVEFTVYDASQQEVGTAVCNTEMEPVVSFFCDVEANQDYTIAIDGEHYSGVAYLQR